MLENNRTDLALELVGEEEKIEGVEIISKSYDDGRINLSEILITNEVGVARLGKPIGRYITIEGKQLDQSEEGIHESFVDILYDRLRNMVGDVKKIFVIGLGNREVTPDALGPNVVDNLCITRHLIREGLWNKEIELSAISPGVMAQTGIESLVILKALCDEVKPDVIIAIDALAANDAHRLNTTIQLCDTGIYPGAGVGNNRLKLSQETLGIKVVAIGVPTVISMTSILNRFKRDEINEDLLEMFVTPKNIDEAIKRISYTISEAINKLIV